MNFHKGFVITQAANLISVRRAGIVKPRRQIHRALLAAYTAAEMFPSRHCRVVPALQGPGRDEGMATHGDGRDAGILRSLSTGQLLIL
jgi:hypothetical protein